MKILFFSPHSYFTVHSLPEKVVANALLTNNNEIISVGCNGLYSSFCVCMTAHKYNIDNKIKQSICKECKFNRNKLINNNNFKNINIDDFISDIEINFVNDEVLMLNQLSFLDYTWNSIPISRYALYEFLLNRKLNSTTFDNDEWNEYKIHFKNALFTAIAGYKILNDFKPDRLTTYNSNYSVNHIICALADKCNIPHYSLHAGGHLKNRLEEMTIFKGYLASYSWNSHKIWSEYLKYPINKKSIFYVNSHIEMLLSAKSPWVYSVKGKKLSENDLKKYFGILPHQKILVATMSSEDERYAAEIVGNIPSKQAPLFKTNFEWINYLINLVKNDETLFLLIRVHPREFPNKRENVLSKQANILETSFKDLPKNIKVNFPKDNISLHDLIKITDVCLNSTSTSGLEFLLFGIPVVIYDKNQLYSYGTELNFMSDNLDSYKENILNAIMCGKSLINVINTYRWLSYRNEIASINIKDGYQAYEYPRLLKKVFYLFNFIYLRNRIEFFLFKLHNYNVINSKKLTVAIENGINSHLDNIDIELYKYNSSFEERNLIIASLLKFTNIVSNEESDPIFVKTIKEICNG